MAGYNRVVLIGNLTRDPEYKQLASGQAVCRLGLASNRQFKNRQTGNLVQEVCYIDIDVWGAQAESCRQYLQKGRPVLIEGRLKFDTWEDPNGQTRSKHSVVADRVIFLSSSSQAETDKEESKVQKESANVKAAVRSEPKAQTKQPAAVEPQSELEKELLDQIEQIKKRTNSEQSSEKPTATGEINFKDEPPFQDDLPF